MIAAIYAFVVTFVLALPILAQAECAWVLLWSSLETWKPEANMNRLGCWYAGEGVPP